MQPIHVTDRDGSKTTIHAETSQSLMEILKDRDFVRGECGGCQICSTCHVLLPPEWYALAGPASQHEADLLDGTLNYVDGASRLSCQIDFTAALAGIRLQIGPDI